MRKWGHARRVRHHGDADSSTCAAYSPRADGGSLPQPVSILFFAQPAIRKHLQDREGRVTDGRAPLPTLRFLKDEGNAMKGIWASGLSVALGWYASGALASELPGRVGQAPPPRGVSLGKPVPVSQVDRRIPNG